jgi:DNA transformation protein and related proteins
MDYLSKMPNIGKEVEKKLVQAGIMTPSDLMKVGSKNAFLRLREFDPGACLCMLCALEGAIRGIRWHNLPEEVKSDLREFSKLKKI